MRVAGKVALVTGGARGLGEAQSKLLAKEGAKVAIGDVLPEDGNRVANDINASGGDAFFIHLDVTSEGEWQKAIDETVSRFGKLDILVNNAGVGGRGGLEDMTVEEWDHVMAVNAKGVFLGTKLSMPEMQKSGKASIVNISSQMGIVGSDTSNPAYTASKAAVHVFTKSIALRYATKGVRVNSIHPGPIDTPMLRSGFDDPERKQKVLARIPMGRTGVPEEVAYGVLFLASDESSFITGEGLVIDGGWMAQ
ncbi:glucose 1-dehydrogenase [SAR202 cluster bacterium AD-493-K16_JPT_193m]|nr:glucose 1-dehydrogenase [SAR202 cluster bacterium AD-493-K16_JPT_193m]